MTNSGNIFADEVTICLIDESGFKHSKCRILIYYKYAPDGSRLVVLSYVDDCVYWYTSEELGKSFLDMLGNNLNVNFLGCVHGFMLIRISQPKGQSNSVDQDRYTISGVTKYLYNATIIINSKLYDINLPHYMIFTNKYASDSDEQVKVFSR